MRRIAIFHKRDNSIVRDPLTPFEADDKKDVGISFWARNMSSRSKSNELATRSFNCRLSFMFGSSDKELWASAIWRLKEDPPLEGDSKVS
jgi:hypothetical protein